MHGIFTNILWYLEFLAFAIVLILFFLLILYLAASNYRPYSPRYDMRKNIRIVVKTVSPPPVVRVREPRQRPLCCDPDCVWFVRLLCSITVIAVCYYFAYTLISDTKLKFGMFVP